MPQLTKTARSIRHSQIKNHYDCFEYSDVSLNEYVDVWRNWLAYTDNKTLEGLDNFKYADYTQGTSQTFDNFIIRHGKSKTVFALKGEFQYHKRTFQRLWLYAS